MEPPLQSPMEIICLVPFGFVIESPIVSLYHCRGEFALLTSFSVSATQSKARHTGLLTPRTISISRSVPIRGCYGDSIASSYSHSFYLLFLLPSSLPCYLFSHPHSFHYSISLRWSLLCIPVSFDSFPLSVRASIGAFIASPFHLNFHSYSFPLLLEPPLHIPIFFDCCA
jgi:hypothetical protein